MAVRRCVLAGALAVSALFACVAPLHADGSGDPTAVRDDDGKYYDKDGNPTYKVQPDGTWDWYTYSGFRRYHSDCHVCHGPYGDGSSYAPALKDSLKTMNYADFATVVINGRKNVSSSEENVMPSFGTNQNVACFLDDIYIYLRARSDDAIARIRPDKHADKSESAKKAEDSCFGTK